MTLGEIVDFCEAYNERQRHQERAEKKTKDKPKPKKRKATAADYQAWFG